MQNSSGTPKWFFRKHAVTLIMWGLFAIIWSLLFSDFSKGPVIVSGKIEPYVLSTKGNTLIIRDRLITVEENRQAPIFVGDKIKTLDSTATIFWPDGSITRLGEKSSIRIHEMRAKTASEDIQVDFSLEEGKSWSNVIKYMFGESYFHERFNNDTALAAVRGTVFEVNLDRKYIHTIDHGVSVQDMKDPAGEGLLLVTDGIISTETRKLLTKSDIDTVWNELNHSADIIYLNEKMESLKKTILENAGRSNHMEAFLRKIGFKRNGPSLETLISGDEAGWSQFKNEMKKRGNSAELMDIYQQFYGLGNTEELLDTKMKLRDLIIETAPDEKKKTFLDDFARSTLYDSWGAMKVGTGSMEWLGKKLEDYMKQGADKKLIDTLKNSAEQQNMKKLDNILENTKQTIIETIGEKNLMEETKKRVDIGKMNDTATEIRNSITDGLEKLTQ